MGESGRVLLTGATVLVAVAVVFIAVLGVRASAGEWCEHVECPDLPVASAALPFDGSSAAHPCLHDHSCAGGAALTLGLLAAAALGAGTALASPDRDLGLLRVARLPAPALRLLATGLERPPRLAH